MRFYHRCHQAILITLVAFGLWGCQNSKTEPPADSPSVDVTAPKPADEIAKKKKKNPTFTASVRSTPKPNVYVVVLEWRNVASDPDAWTIDKRDGQIIVAPFSTLAGSVRRLTDLDVIAGKTYTYSLKTDQREDSEPLESVTVTIPKDQEIHGKQELGSLTKINRLFLYPDSELITQGKEFQLEVNEILSQGGTIESFAENAAPSIPGSDGKSAESIHIRAKGGTGVLHLIARGENGAQGIPGTAGTPGAPGKAGFCWSEASYVFPGDGGPAGDGLEGGPGGHGGNSPRVLVEIENPRGLKIVPNKIAGHGGAGGPGGMPGIGGPGGIKPPYARCMVIGGVGHKGPDGKRGPDGKEGANGITQPICLKLRTMELGDCDAFSASAGK